MVVDEILNIVVEFEEAPSLLVDGQALEMDDPIDASNVEPIPPPIVPLQAPPVEVIEFPNLNDIALVIYKEVIKMEDLLGVETIPAGSSPDGPKPQCFLVETIELPVDHVFSFLASGLGQGYQYRDTMLYRFLHDSIIIL